MGTVGDHNKKHPEGEEHREEERPRRRKKPKHEGGEGQDGEVIGEEEEEEFEEEPAHLEEPTTPDNYTICAPQLLHLDMDGKPFWFNGWLLDNKFADKKQKKFGKFDHYLREPQDIREPGAWQLEEANMCCLTTDADKKFEFADWEKQLLLDMMAKAKEVGAPGSG
jgi:alpha 1,3-mannosyltransferase